MSRDSDKIINELTSALPEIDKALDVLAEHQVLIYTSLLIAERLFDPALAAYPHIKERSDFLNGAFEFMKVLSTLPEALKHAMKGN